MNKVWEWLVTKAYAADAGKFTIWGTNTDQGPLGVGNDDSSLVKLLDVIVTRFAEIAGGLAFIALIIGAWQYLFAGGDESRAEAGKKTITWAIVGIALALLFFAIVKFAVGGVLG